MSNVTALNSISSSDHTSDEDDLKALKLTENDLDNFAAYFELTFQGNTENITVLVGFLQRLSAIEKLRQRKASGIWIEDIVGRFTRHLFARGEPGVDAAARFRAEASGLAENIFSEAFATE